MYTAEIFRAFLNLCPEGAGVPLMGQENIELTLRM